MPSDPGHLPLIVTRGDALAAGLTADEVRQRVRSGRWRRLDTGVYLRTAVRAISLDDHAEARVAHVERAVAAARRHQGCVIVTGTAALLLGLPLTSGVPDLAELVAPPGGWTGIRKGVRYRKATLPAEDVTGIGIPVTTVARTVVDVARLRGLADGLAVGDAALRAGVLTIDQARTTLERMGGVRGRRVCAAVLDQMDTRRETALESLSWARFLEWKLPLPVMQREFRDQYGLAGRVDFWWEGWRLVGEADGRLKYATADDLYAEKRREDRLRALGLQVVRWGWSDLWGAAGERLRQRLLALLR